MAKEKQQILVKNNNQTQFIPGIHRLTEPIFTNKPSQKSFSDLRAMCNPRELAIINDIISKIGYN